LLTTQQAPGRSTRTALAGLAALGSVVAASSCCLPILPFAFAAGAAGSSAILTAMRPYLLGVAAAFIAYGFYQAWRAKQCRRRPNFLSTLLLWTSAVVVAVSLFFPQVMAEAAADLLAR
jgi:cytochrome bd-type quinol oxidase subunit 2